MFLYPNHAPRLLPALVAALALAAGAAAAPLTPQEQAGKKVYEEGVSPSGGAITARVGLSDFDVPGTAVPCASCHGPDGLGRPEGGVLPPNIQWSELARPYGHVHPNGRKHPAFDERAAEKAVTLGVDPGGNELDRSMPRYRMPDADARSLVAYLKKLEFQLPPGVSAGRVRIGTVLPPGELGKGLKGVLEAAFDTVNRKGGLYGRRLELVAADYGQGPETAYANAWELATKGDVFILLAPFSARWEAELGRIASDARIPVISPLTLFPEDTRASNQYVFHLLSGVGELGQVLARHAAEALQIKTAPVALLHPDTRPGRELAESLKVRLLEQGWTQVAGEPFRPGGFDAEAIAGSLKARGVQGVFVLGAGTDLAGLARAAAQTGWLPYLLVPGSLAPREIMELPPAFEGRVFLAYPTLPSDQKPEALKEYAALYQSRPIPRGFQTLQVPAYAGALATIEVMKRVGKDLNRQKFQAVLETLQSYETGMLPPLSYNADRRIGALGGYVVVPDLQQKQFRPVGGFFSLN